MTRRAPARRSTATSSGATVRPRPWGWGAGILVAASKDTEVYGNTLAWNKVGISFISQQRGDDPGMTGNYSHDNFMAGAQMAAGQDHFGEFWA